MRKILLVTNDFPPMVGGVARCYERICATVPSRCVVVLSLRVPGDTSFDAEQGYRIVRVRVPAGRHPMARAVQLVIFCLHALRTARRERVDAVHIGQLHLGPLALVLKRLLRLPYVIYLHGGEMAPYMRFRAVRAAMRAVIGGARTAVVNSAYTLRYFEGLGIRIPCARILTMSVETDRFHPAVDAQPIRARYGLNGHKILLTVARLDDYKGHDMIIRALPSVRQAVGPIRYLIVGRGQEERRLRELASSVGCSSEVVFTGHIPDSELPAIYAACDVFIMPSRELRDGDFEGFGIVFLEAGACGKPVIGGRSGGVPEAVIDGTTGILVDPRDAHAIAAALTHVLLDRGEAVRLGRHGRLRAEQLRSRWKRTLVRLWRA